jgi:hypothetical protein
MTPQRRKYGTSNGLEPFNRHREGHPINTSVDLTALRAELIKRLNRTVELVARAPKDGTPGVVIVENTDGDAIEIDPDLMNEAISNARSAALLTNERRALTVIDTTTDVKSQVAAIRGWLAREAGAEQ